MDLFDLSGRLALVTGAGRGLGRAAALGLASAGADVALAARSTAELEAVAREVRGLGRQASTHLVDVRSTERIAAMVAEVHTQHGRIDILVNNAGTKAPKMVAEVTEGDWDLVLDTNLKGAFFCAQAVGRSMVERGSGKIINVASTFSIRAAPGRATYAASKGGLLQLTRVMAAEWAPRGVNVNAIGPTAARTVMNEPVFAVEGYEERMRASIPAGRLCEPEDIVGSVVFLASRASDLVHGHLLLIDGGRTIL